MSCLGCVGESYYSHIKSIAKNQKKGIVNEVKIPEEHKICDTPMGGIETAHETNEGFHDRL